ncbi:hypothetical protein HDU85_003314 [Gaertneriomyces sp. JEL0708]|nr:hypothetical protein HDU85_003314 [Gaertneriomyces sp. JEL0708]
MAIPDASYNVYSLPPCQYPHKPYGGFTTLLHRFGRYEKMKSMENDQSWLLRESIDLQTDRPPNPVNLPRRSKNPWRRMSTGSEEEIARELQRMDAALAALREEMYTMDSPAPSPASIAPINVVPSSVTPGNSTVTEKPSSRSRKMSLPNIFSRTKKTVPQLSGDTRIDGKVPRPQTLDASANVPVVFVNSRKISGAHAATHPNFMASFRGWRKLRV